MRLLKRSDSGEFSLTKDLSDDQIPRYAILSHTWRDEEITYEDFIQGNIESKPTYEKIRFCGEQAARDGLTHFWVDTCCINKASSAELQEAVISMFRWYQRAKICYVYLSDVSANDQSSRWNWEQAFRQSRWFTRGWTLQELLAPSTVKLFSREGTVLGDKKDLEDLISSITGISIRALQGIPLPCFETGERFSWTRSRHTTRGEDEAYSLLGIFGISMAVRYGEGRESAVNRLRRKIHKALEDENRGKMLQNHSLEKTAPQPNKAGPVDELTILRENPHFRQLRLAIQKQPEMLHGVLQQLSASNPQLGLEIRRRPEEFMRLLSEDEEGQDTSFTSGELTALDRLCRLGFERDLVLQAFLACNRNEEMTAIFLFDQPYDE